MKNKIVTRNLPGFIMLLVSMISASNFGYAQCSNNWSGTSPTVSFELDSATIKGYSIAFTDIGCFTSISFTFSSIFVRGSSFTHNFNAYPNSGTITGEFSGDGNTVTGTYELSLGMLHPIYGYRISCGTASGSWSALPETPHPVANAGSDVTVCEGLNVTLTATGGSSYAWSGNITNGVAFTPTETTTYTVTATADNGCTDTDKVTVTVNPAPIANAGSDVTVCAGQSAILTATGGTSYAWSGSITNGVAFTPTETATYTVTATADNGCTDSDEVTVTVNPAPIANAGSDVTVCAGQSTVLTATGGTSYAWSGSITNGVAFTPTETTTYTVTATADNGCTDTDDVTVTVNPLPIASAGPDVEVCMGQSVTLTATGGVSYAWNGGISNGIAFTPETTETYSVTVTGSNGCTATDEITVVVNNCNDIKSPEKNAVKINLFPNPVNDELYLVIKDIGSELSITITSIRGQTVFTRNYFSLSGTLEDKVKVKNFCRGIYFVTINDGKTIQTEKIIVE